MKKMSLRRKIASKAICVAIATTLVIGGTTVFAAERVNAGDSTTVEFNSYDTRVNFSFVPETDGDYVFTASDLDNSKLDASIRVYRGSNLVGEAEGDDYSLVLTDLEAGKTYQIQTFGNGLRGGQEGSYVLTITSLTPVAEDVAPDYGMPDIDLDTDTTTGDNNTNSETTVPQDNTPSADTHNTTPSTTSNNNNNTTAAATTATATAAPATASVSTNLPAVNGKEALVYGFVERLYTDALGREFDVAGRAYWVDMMLNQNASGSKVADSFLTSSEFTGRNLSDEQFVNTLYHVFFNRTASAAEVANWTGALANGATRSQVIAGFEGSAEWADTCAFYKVNV